jgi:hypothetical protein
MEKSSGGRMAGLYQVIIKVINGRKERMRKRRREAFNIDSVLN